MNRLSLRHRVGNTIQRAINILKSAGPGAWYDPSDIASYTATGPELVTNGTVEAFVNSKTKAFV